MMQFPTYYVNKSTLATDEEVRLMAKACDLQFVRDVGPTWGIATRPEGCNIVFAKAEDVPRGSAVQLFIDDPTDPGALGEHWEGRDGSIQGAIFLRPCAEEGNSDAFTGKCPFSTVASHEGAIEAPINPKVNLWCDMPDGWSYIREGADPVENDYYLIEVEGVNVPVSNFVTPSYFDQTPVKGSRFDFLGTLKGHAPTLHPEGYLIRRRTPSQEKQLNARMLHNDDRPHLVFGHNYPDWRKSMKRAVVVSKIARRSRMTGTAEPF